jgi:hypothetical protein
MRKSIHLIGRDSHELYLLEAAIKEKRPSSEDITWRIPLSVLYPACEKMSVKIVQSESGHLTYAIDDSHILLQYRNKTWRMRSVDLFATLNSYDRSKVLTVLFIGHYVECQIGNEIYIFWNDKTPGLIIETINHLPHDSVFG